MREIPGPLTLIAGLVVLALVFGALERVGRSLPSKPLLRRERLTDFGWWFVTPWVGQTASTIAIIGAVAAITIALRLASIGEVSPAWFERQPAALQLIEFLVLADLLGYAAHRLFHGRRLWRFHAIHHSAEDLDWLAATRVHPINEIGNRLIQVIPLYLLGFRGPVLAAVVPVFTFYALFVHANLRWDFGPLRYVIASPVFHRWHHTQEAEGRDRNFAGLFPWIDLLFGTLYLPRGRQPERFGVEDPVPRRLLGQLIYPFRS
jgi:sterol desaturase/sphingolipid hydroxylase (fatty acid hydroxylase superfamily)